MKILTVFGLTIFCMNTNSNRKLTAKASETSVLPPSNWFNWMPNNLIQSLINTLWKLSFIIPQMDHMIFLGMVLSTLSLWGILLIRLGDGLEDVRKLMVTGKVLLMWMFSTLWERSELTGKLVNGIHFQCKSLEKFIATTFMKPIFMLISTGKTGEFSCMDRLKTKWCQFHLF